MSLIYCACGCNTLFEEFDNRGRVRKYIKEHGRIGKHHSNKAKEKMSKSAHHSGKENGRYIDGRSFNKEYISKRYKQYMQTLSGKEANKKRCNKRHRNLGFELINECLNDDEVCHHLTIDFVAYVPEFLNKSMYHNIYTGKIWIVLIILFLIIYF